MSIVSTLLMTISAIILTAAAYSSAAVADVVQNDHDLYYAGDARIMDLFTGATQTQKVILKKSMLPSQSMFMEIACIQSADKPAEISPVYMRVVDTSFEISDTIHFDNTGKLSGKGELAGPVWDWTTLKFHMVYKDGEKQAKIEDVNFVVGTRLIARKQLYLPDGRGFQLYELEMEQIDLPGFTSRAQQMQCPALPN